MKNSDSDSIWQILLSIVAYDCLGYIVKIFATFYNIFDQSDQALRVIVQ